VRFINVFQKAQKFIEKKKPFHVHFAEKIVGNIYSRYTTGEDQWGDILMYQIASTLKQK